MQLRSLRSWFLESTGRSRRAEVWTRAAEITNAIGSSVTRCLLFLALHNFQDLEELRMRFLKVVMPHCNTRLSSTKDSMWGFLKEWDGED